ncbi:DnaJ-domain-containing protein [Piromyces finnis]|uniref:DnaJ-domain-containing protein n=1 Tax=Piromyces finnis TaxID=1754191 RepID=A0A1Y1VA05_9FUNG|nr:DnaJ-domain-containing protein [Piromyces finnis]|eukprot:ORX50062.1 DnaJ-domain-containing protein [Piromyces finnis]
MDYYAILNVPKTATQDEIKNAYKKLCILYHPDKHSSDINKTVAQREFQKINKAYDILGNTKNKIIYDKYGEKGLDKTWDIGPLYKTPEQILSEFESQVKFKKEMELEHILKSRGEIKLTFDASGQVRQPMSPHYVAPNQPHIYPHYGKHPMPAHPPPPPKPVTRGLAELLHLPILQNTLIFHSWQNDITPKDSINFTGQAFSHQGMNIVSVIGTLSHTINSSLVTEVSTCLGSQPYIQGRVIKNFTSDCFITSTATMSTVDAPPNFTFVAGRQISPNYTGMISYNTGHYSLGQWGKKQKPGEASSVTLTLIRRKGKTNIQGSVTVGLMESHIRLSYAKSLTKHLRLKLHALLSSFSGGNFGVAFDRKVTKFSGVGFGLNCSSIAGFSVQLRYSRLGQTITLPIIISHDLTIHVLFWGSIIPLSAVYFFNQYVLIPYQKNDLKRKIDIIKTANSDILAQRKKEAEESIRLMSETIEKKINIEKQNDGLIIIEGLYGDAKLLKKMKKLTYQQNQPNKPLPDEIIDVTIPLQNMVNKSQLHLGSYSKSSLIGFYDPCFGKEKVLRVVYIFQGRIHLIEVGENTPLFAPLRDHIVNNTFELPKDITL